MFAKPKLGLLDLFKFFKVNKQLAWILTRDIWAHMNLGHCVKSVRVCIPIDIEHSPVSNLIVADSVTFIFFSDN